MRSRRLVAVAVAAALGLTAASCGTEGNPQAIESNASEPVVTDTAEPATTDSSSTDPGTTGPDATVPSTTEDTRPGATDPDDTDGPDTSDSTPDPSADAFGWDATMPGVEVGSLEVPIDHDDPSKGSIVLHVARHLADPDERIGSLLVNPGGPGFGGSDFAIYAEQIYSDDLIERFDIIGWDPRGTGESEPAIDCIDDYDRYFASTDITPDDDEERQEIVDLAREFGELCAENNDEILQYVGTNNSARDMDAIRRALGEDTISYFGFSYGSELGATWATLFPDTVRAAVLDGAADPEADFIESGLQQSKGFEAAVAEFLAACSEDDGCAFHNGGDAEAAFDELMTALDEDPIPSEPDRPDVTRGVALVAVVQAMYSEALWPSLERALAEAQDGDGAGLLELYDAYYQRQPDGTYDNSLEAFQTISCMDEETRLTVEEEDAAAERFTDVAPRVAPGTTGSYFCTFFPPAQDPRVDVTGAGAGPILVVGTTGDPATPLASTENMAEALEDGVLLVVVANRHTGYGVNQCSYDTIDGYLIDLDVPEDGTRCE